MQCNQSEQAVTHAQGHRGGRKWQLSDEGGRALHCGGTVHVSPGREARPAESEDPLGAEFKRW